jgi:guanylate kinase
MLIVASPSGAGKTSLCRRLMADNAELMLSISVTTRAVRPGEQDGRDYHFVDPDAFARMVEEDAFLEHAGVHDHAYGSPRAPVEAALGEGRDVLFDIDWQGARRVAEEAPDDTVRVFILPPSIEELRRRLYARAQDAPEVIERRIMRARDEIARWGEFDYVIVNDDFDGSYAELAHIYRGERIRRQRNGWIPEFVDGLMRNLEEDAGAR